MELLLAPLIFEFTLCFLITPSPSARSLFLSNFELIPSQLFCRFSSTRPSLSLMVRFRSVRFLLFRLPLRLRRCLCRFRPSPRALPAPSPPRPSAPLFPWPSPPSTPCSPLFLLLAFSSPIPLLPMLLCPARRPSRPSPKWPPKCTAPAPCPLLPTLLRFFF